MKEHVDSSNVSNFIIRRNVRTTSFISRAHEVIADVKYSTCPISNPNSTLSSFSTTHLSSRIMSTRQAIHAPAAPKPNGNYSHVIRSGDKLFLCGWMGDDPETGEIVGGGIEAQTVCVTFATQWSQGECTCCHSFAHV